MRIFDSPRERVQLLIMGLGLAILFAVAPFVTGLLGAAVLFVIFAPAHRRLTRWMPSGAAAAILLTVASTVIIIPGVLLVIILAGRTPEALRAIQNSAFSEGLAGIQVAGLDVGALIASTSDAVFGWASRQALRLFGGVARQTLNLTIALFGLYFMLIATPQAWVRARELVPFSRPTVESLTARFHSVTEAMLIGITVTAVLQGSVVAAGFWLTGLPGAPVWGVVTAFASVLPLFGSALVWLPGSFVLMLHGQWGAALALIAIGAGVASTIDNITRPMVYRRVSHIHPMTTVVGAFAGVAMFGLAGVLLGPLAITYFFELLRAYRLEYGSVTTIAQSSPGPSSRAPAMIS
jgi:predicted PurR-regulated permease PerM